MWLAWLVQCIQCRDDECFSRKLSFHLFHTGHYCLPRLPHLGFVWFSSHPPRVVLIWRRSLGYPTFRQQSSSFRSFRLHLDQADSWLGLHIPQTWPNNALLAPHNYYYYYLVLHHLFLKWWGPALIEVVDSSLFEQLPHT